jgi:hypothetical protein
VHHGLPTKPPWRPINLILNFLTAYLQSLLILLIIVCFEPEKQLRYLPKSQRAPPTWINACANKAKVQLARLCGKLEETMYAVLRSTSSHQHHTKRNFAFDLLTLLSGLKHRTSQPSLPMLCMAPSPLDLTVCSDTHTLILTRSLCASTTVHRDQCHCT